MMLPTCDAVCVTCIDFRFQATFDRWLQENLGHGHYDRVGIAGGIKDWDKVFPQIEISRRLHKVKKAILVNHEDCGAYGEAGSRTRHIADMKIARQRTLERFPDMEVAMYYATLDGVMERVY
jgi:carbonic anhydrase